MVYSLYMRLIIQNDSPALLRIQDLEDPHGTLAVGLTYADKAAEYTYLRFKKASWMLSKLGPEKFQEELDRLKAERKKSLLFEDEKGFYTYAGLAPLVSSITGLQVENQVEYPAKKLIAWDNPPPYQPYPYQLDSKNALSDAKHAGIEVGTGLGKSYVIQLLVREHGLKTIVMTPSTSISEQLYRSFVKLFGKKNVGKFFGTKKETSKLITVANAQSLTRVTPDSPHFEALSKVKVFIADESHQCPAATLESVCIGVAVGAPYRYFLSATQLRADGRDLVLDGITGPIVYRKTVKEGVDEKYLAKPLFRTISVPSESKFEGSDANEMTRAHLYYNDAVNEKIGNLVNASVAAGRPVLVIIEEVEQFTRLLPHFRYEAKFAHGPLGENKAKVPQPYWESDVTQLVDDFNAEKFPILVGTSCISTGTDIKAVKTLVFLQGGKSEVGVRQAIGRATRLNPGKTNCTVIDVNVYNVPTLARHFKSRVQIYNSLYPSLKEIQ